MDKGIKGYVGLDVHKDSISVAVADRDGSAARFVGRIAHDVPRVLKVLRRIGAKGELKIVYEAGPTGYGLQRALVTEGYDCEVIAPSLIPQRCGNRVKTDRHDSVRLTR